MTSDTRIDGPRVAENDFVGKSMPGSGATTNFMMGWPSPRFRGREFTTIAQACSTSASIGSRDLSLGDAARKIVPARGSCPGQTETSPNGDSFPRTRKPTRAAPFEPLTETHAALSTTRARNARAFHYVRGSYFFGAVARASGVSPTNGKFFASSNRITVRILDSS